MIFYNLFEGKMKRRVGCLKIMIHLALFLFFTQAFLLAQPTATYLIPFPQHVTFFNETFKCDSTSRIVLGAGSGTAENFVAALINDHLLSTCGFKLSVVQEENSTERKNILFLGSLKTSEFAREFSAQFDAATRARIGKEGYLLQAKSDMVAITANTSAGLFYGCMTLKQMLRPDGSGVQIPGATIYDWPAYPFRGIRFDIRNGPLPNLDFFKKMIRYLGELKLNTCLLYLGNCFRFEGLPQIVKSGTTLSHEEVAELQTYAAQLHIQIIPEMETLTDLDEILLLPQFAHLTEFPGALTISPENEKAYPLLDMTITEIATAFSAPYLHVGQSVAHEIGRGASENAVTNRGLANIIAEHFQRVYSTVKKNNKQVLVNADLIFNFPEILFQLPEDVIFIATSGLEKIPSPLLTAIMKKRLNLILAPQLWTGESIFADSYAKFFQLQKMLQTELAAGVTGVVATHRQRPLGFVFHEYNYQGYAFTAQSAWYPQARDIEQFNKAFFALYYGTEKFEFELIYNLLSDLQRLAPWKEMWRHPLLFFQNPQWGKYQSIHNLKSRMQAVVQLIESNSPTITRNKDQLDYLKFAAQQGIWFANKIQTLHEIEQMKNHFHDESGNNQAKKIMDTCFQLIEELNQLQETLQLLWMRDYRAEDLRRFMEFYLVQIDYWQEIIGYLQSGQLFKNHLLASQWIYHPGSGESQLQSEGGAHVFFRKTFDIRAGFQRAYIQALADTHLKLYLNGGYLGEVINFDSNSENNPSVSIWDVTPLLQPGKNVIAVEAWNYQPAAQAGINVYGQTVYEFGRTSEVFSNTYWKTSQQETQNWQNLGFYDVQWLNAEVHKKQKLILKPNFKLARPSIIDE